MNLTRARRVWCEAVALPGWAMGLSVGGKCRGKVQKAKETVKGGNDDGQMEFDGGSDGNA